MKHYRTFAGKNMEASVLSDYLRHLALWLPKEHLRHHSAIQLLSPPLTPPCNASNSHHPFGDTTATLPTTNSWWFCYISGLNFHNRQLLILNNHISAKQKIISFIYPLIDVIFFLSFKLNEKSLLRRAASCCLTSDIIIRCQRARLARVKWIITITTTFTKYRSRSG